MSRRTWRAALTMATVGAVACLTGISPVHAAGADYVALGDSYSSGTGTRDYIDDGTGCQRSTYAYPSLVAARKGAALDFQACQGATTQTVLEQQVAALGSSTKYVTVSVGGNDAGFASVVTTCAAPRSDARCDAAVDTAQAVVRDQLPDRLESVYDEIDGRAPSATVVVVGYPRLFNGEDCNAATWFSPHEEQRLNATADLIASATATRAAAHGFTFADARDRFTGHAVCDDPPWLNGLANPLTESYHPNRDGQAAYADLVGGSL